VLIIVRKKYSRPVILFGILFLVTDLYAASFIDIRGDLASYKSALAPSPIVEILKKEKAAGNLGRVYGCRAPSQSLPLVPSQNMLYGIEDIGAYSPLVMSRYYETVGRFGNINDSNYAFTPTPSFIDDHLPILKFLNVSHVLSSEPLNHGRWVLVDTSKENIFLYRALNDRKSAYFVSDFKAYDQWDDLRHDFMTRKFNPADKLLLEKTELEKYGISPERDGFSREPAVLEALSEDSAESVWKVEFPGPGFMVRSCMMYPGWTANVNGQAVPILKAYGLFQAIRIPRRGSYHVEFRFVPFKILKKERLNAPGS
jgi:hypothetical protein